MATILVVTALLFTIIKNDLTITAVPLSGLNPISTISNNDIINSNSNNNINNNDDGGTGGEEIGIDDFTTHGLERLSSAATCLVAGVEYTHGQQIYRLDPCEFCLCLDGEMFCWWQDCPPTMEGPCKDRGPFTPCLNIPSSEIGFSSSSAGLSTPTLTKSTTNNINNNNNNEISSESSSSFSTDLDFIENSTITDSSSTITDDFNSNDNNSTEDASITTMPSSSNPENLKKVCILMGQKYEIGDKLPHDTGNCVECVCGQGAKVTCSPHQCAPAGEDISDYRQPGPRQQVQDVF